MRRFLGLTLLTAVAAATLFALSANQAMANHVQCGNVITHDTTLDSDLIDCPGDALVVGADDITIDLAGHTVDGPGAAVLPASVGVDDTGGYDGIEVRNGVVRDFGVGVELADADRNVIRGLTLVGSGIFIYGFSDANVIEYNRVTSAQLGIAMSDSDSNLIRDNEVIDTGRGINIGGGELNDVRGNSASSSEVGIAVADAPDNTLVRNSVFGNGVGIEANDSAYRTRVERNFAYRNAKDGIQVECCQSLVIRNVASANGGDGIYVAYGGVDEFGPDQVIRNTANFNGDLGIEGLGAGVTDGGGNRAFGNGNPLQCLNVSCKPAGRKK